MSRKPKPQAQTSYDSIASAAAALGIEKPILRRAKRDGAPGFRGSRVYPLDLLPWLNAQKKPAADTKEEIERRMLLKKEREMDFDFQCKQKLWVLQSDVDRGTSETVTAFVRILDAIPSTLAPDLVGVATIAEAEARIRTALEQAKRTLYEGKWV